MAEAYGIIYFSGTGNTKLIAEHAAGLLPAEIHSIEEELDWPFFIRQVERLIFFYPVHYAVPPMIMRAFLKDYARALEHKEVICIASQMIASGDGARALEDFLPDSARLIACYHVNMPNNIANLPVLPVSSEKGNRRKVGRAVHKTEKIIEKIKKGTFERQHSGPLSRKIGDSQRIGGLQSEQAKRSCVWVSDACIHCGLCARICPTHNFRIRDKAVPQGECTLCMRCENRCPARAISVLLHKPVKEAYPGPLYEGRIGVASED